MRVLSVSGDVLAVEGPPGGFLLGRRQGVPARVVMKILGHSQITLTLGTYFHFVPELAEDAARHMGEAPWG